MSLWTESFRLNHTIDIIMFYILETILLYIFNEFDCEF